MEATFPKCGQAKCSEDASFRYTWPGQDEAFICVGCALKLAGVARAISCPLQLLPLDIHDLERHAKEAELRALRAKERAE